MEHDVRERIVTCRIREKLRQRKPTDKHTSQDIRMNISGSSRVEGGAWGGGVATGL